jgi:hypothetical protein
MKDCTKYLVSIWAVLLFLSIMACTSDKNDAGVTGNVDVGGWGGSGAGGAQAGIQASSGASGQQDAIAAQLDASSTNNEGGDNPQPSVDAAGVITDAANVVIDAAGDVSIATLDAGPSPIDSAIAPAEDATVVTDAAPAADAAPTTGTFPPVTDLIANGPYSAVTINASGPNNEYTIYHPSELAPNGVKNPFVTWGNGMTTVPSMYTLLPHLATHGFVIIASNNSSVTPEEMRAGIDWLFAENDRSGSVFYQKLDTSKVASMGYSLGSDCTFKIGDDPRLTTTVHISGGAFDKADTAKLKNPAIFLCGGLGGDGYITGDVARTNCDSDFEVATVPVFYGNFDDGHLGILMSPYMEMIREAVTGWLRWRLMADESLKSMFVGSDCGLCQDPNWEVRQKDLT